MDFYDLQNSMISAYIFGIIISILAPIILIVVLTIYQKRLIKNKNKQTFEYLDTFYYSYVELNGADDGSDIITKVYNVVRDLNSHKIYVIPESSFRNACHEITMNNFKILKGTGFRNNLKDVNFNSKGSFWIDKESNDFYKRDENLVNFGKQELLYSVDADDGKYYTISVATPKLYNINKKYDISLLDEAIFAYGVAEFDMND